jgi:hypothetical protein
VTGATHHLLGPTLDEAVHSILETHLDGGIELDKWPELLALVQVIYPSVETASDALVAVDVYRIEVTQINQQDSKVYRVGDQRAMATVTNLLKTDGVSYVTVIREDRS